MQKRTKSILWPFILFRLLLFIYWIVIESHFRDFDMGPIWFLIILYLAELVAYPIFYNKKSNSFWIVSVCCLVAVLWFTLKLVLPANFLSSWFLRFLNGLMWYILGYVCPERKAAKTVPKLILPKTSIPDCREVGDYCVSEYRDHFHHY